MYRLNSMQQQLRNPKLYPMNGFRLLFLLVFLFGAKIVFGQQLSLFTQYRENATLINPAAVESDFFSLGLPMTIGATYRTQWSGFADAPRTQSVRFSYINPDSKGVGLMPGGYVFNDQTGPTGFTGVYGRVAGVLSADPLYNGFIVGLSAGYVQYRIKSSEVVLRDQNDILGSVNQATSYPDFGVGVYFYQTVGKRDYFYAGVSVPQVAGLDLTFKNDNGDFTLKRVQHYYGMVGMYNFFDNDGFLESSLWAKYAQNVPVNVDANIRYQTPHNFWIGTGISSAKNFHIDAGVVLGDMYNADNLVRIGYGYDYSFSEFGPSAGSSHEINLTFSLNR